VTPKASDCKDSLLRESSSEYRKSGAKVQIALPQQVAREEVSSNWQTPTAMEAGKVSNLVGNQKGQLGLSNDPYLEWGQRERWVTPCTRDYKESNLTRPRCARKDGKARMDTLPQKVLFDDKYRGVLNPRWVETLMGLPLGWATPLEVKKKTDILSRNDELQMIGNGVVPQTAEVAIRILLKRLEGE